MSNSVISRKDLRTFGITIASGVVILFGGIFPWLSQSGIPSWPWVLCTIIITGVVIKPEALIIVYKPWMCLGRVLGTINTTLVLGVIYYLFLTPLSVVMKITKRDPLRQKIDVEVSTYRRPSEKREGSHVERSY